MIGASKNLAQNPKPLPHCRSDLQIELAAGQKGALPSVTVTDPVRGSYFRLQWPASGLMLHWQDVTTFEELQALMAASYGEQVMLTDVEAVAEFLFANQLTVSDPSGGWQRYASIRDTGKHGIFKTLIHSYLFFRVPLVRPQAQLERLLPMLSFVYTRRFWFAILALALTGVYLASRQWATLVAAAQDAMRFEGLLLHAMVILGLKGMHELGHALTTVRFGCRVPTMGVAVMLGAPVLYTDTSDSWRLTSRSERLSIVFAGVAAELIVASFAILLWCFLPDGTARQICFTLATASIVLSLAVNLNPFMRFDGYFALSDFLEVPNLQPRAFALATWRLREAIFHLGHEPPEKPSVRLRRTMITYAIATGLYRLALYLGIAAVVYVMAGKALGIVLGLFEVAVFIAQPVYKELAVWWSLRAHLLRSRRSRASLAVVLMALVLMMVPWISSVEAPSVLVAGDEEQVHLPYPALLSKIAVRNGEAVEKGQILFVAASVDLDRQYKKTEIERRVLEMQMGRLHASEKELEQRLVIQSRLAQVRERLSALARQRDQLFVRAPISGTVVDLDPDIAPGNWVNTKLPLARIVSDTQPRVRSVIAETDVARLTSGAVATFVSDDPAAARRTLKLVSIAPASDGRLSEPVLAEKHGGLVAVGEERGELRTRHGWFELTFEASGDRPIQLARGVARIDAARVSPISLMWQQICRVVIREQGF
jgi:putative peptide zinc metalloprotease protein